jgi:murein L,D-transpeptidase YcbB/YkuD
MPVIIFYLTALPAPDGEFYALEDIYDRDQAVLEELNAEYQSNQKSAKSE